MNHLIILPARASAWLMLVIVALRLDGSAHAQNAPPIAQPTPQHQLLKKDVGTWDATMKAWFAPSAEPVVSQGTERNELLRGGLWLISRYEGHIADTAFVGCGTFGFDPLKQKYVGTWVDNVTSNLSVLEGDYDADARTLTMISHRRNPHTGKPAITKSI